MRRQLGREVVAGDDAPAHVAPEAARAQHVVFQEPQFLVARLVGQGERAARGGRGVPAGGREQGVQGLAVLQLVLALVGVVHRRAYWFLVLVLLQEPPAPRAQGLGHHHADRLGAVGQVHLAADARGHLRAPEHDQVVHVEDPAHDVGPAVVQVPAHPAAVHGGARARPVAAEIVGGGARQHAGAAAGHA